MKLRIAAIAQPRTLSADFLTAYGKRFATNWTPRWLYWGEIVQYHPNALPQSSSDDGSNGHRQAAVSRSFSSSIHNRMVAFIEWLVHRDAAVVLRLLETAAFFNPQSYNPVFENELTKLLARLRDPDARQQAMSLRGFDWGDYLARSLQRSAFKDDDQQEAFHAIVVKLLVQPGKLFSGWRPNQHGSLDRRFKRSVWNAIRNFAVKNRNLRRRITPIDPTVMAGRFAERQPRSNLIEQFRKVVSERLGRLALAILDHRLEQRDSNELVGNAAFGNPTAHTVKREVRAIKELARQFAAASGDQSFLNTLTKAMEDEATTIEKRKAALAARSAKTA